MQLTNHQYILKFILITILHVTIIRAFEYDALLSEENGLLTTDSQGMNSMELKNFPNERSLISKMIERGKILMKSLPQTGIKLAGTVLNFVPTPETVFNVGKQTLIGLPQELIAYAVNSVCK